MEDDLKQIIEKQSIVIEGLNDELKKQANTISKLLSLIGVTSIIASSLDKSQVLKSILEQTKILMECKQSSVMLIDPVKNQLYFEVLANEEEMAFLKDIRLEKGEGIAGTVWRDGIPILIEDASKDSRFSKKADEKLDSRTKSLIAVPLIVKDTVIGVMEAMNKFDETSFNSFDLEIFKTLSVQAAIAIDNARLYELAITDGMTKLFIHRYFQARLVEEFNRSARYGRELSLIMFDIDHFKNFNDSYGHQLGDEVLKNTAKVIKENSRAADIPARYGGEEFALILPETNKEGTMALAERIRKRIEEMTIEFEGKKVKLTISAGVSSYINNMPKTEQEFIQMADAALYHSKENGRNRVTFYEPSIKK
jgi:diguanylate cyclase (GGDEF)-like protein